ncbi:MAG: hypothetical protein AB1488_11775 [Nitrospirota bacterium]
MSQVLDLKNVVEDIVTSYEARVKNIGAIFDATPLILGEFQESLFNTRQEREKINTQLRDILAKNESLRRKDFDHMMQGILSTQDAREKEVRNLLNSYLNEQKEMTQVLRERLGRFKDSLARGENQRIKEFQEMIKDIVAKQDKRKEEVTSKLKEFQEKQQVLTSRLRELLSKGRELRIKDFKSMLKEFKAQHKERLAHQEERKKEVRHLLGEFKKKRRD